MSIPTSELANELTSKFGHQLLKLYQPRADELCVELLTGQNRDLLIHLRQQYEARVVTFFAEDRVDEEGVFFTYHVLEQCGSPVYVIVKTPISPERPEFESLAAEMPALNWQEREVQDWFGLKAVGH